MTDQSAAAIAQRIAQLVAVITHTPPPAEPAGLTRGALEEWDSLAHVEIMFAVEEEFDLEFDETAMRSADGVADIAAAVVRLRAESA